MSDFPFIFPLFWHFLDFLQWACFFLGRKGERKKEGKWRREGVREGRGPRTKERHLASWVKRGNWQRINKQNSRKKVLATLGMEKKTTGQLEWGLRGWGRLPLAWVALTWRMTLGFFFLKAHYKINGENLLYNSEMEVGVVWLGKLRDMEGRANLTKKTLITKNGIAKRWWWHRLFYSTLKTPKTFKNVFINDTECTLSSSVLTIFIDDRLEEE